jgi:hypothetical protein
VDSVVLRIYGMGAYIDQGNPAFEVQAHAARRRVLQGSR